MRKPLEQYSIVSRFFIQTWACIILVVMVVYVMTKTAYAKMIGKHYYWKSDTIR